VASSSGPLEAANPPRKSFQKRFVHARTLVEVEKTYLSGAPDRCFLVAATRDGFVQ
jgi:hypothetical protein